MKTIAVILMMFALLVAVTGCQPATGPLRCVVEQTTAVHLDHTSQAEIVDTVEAAPDSPVLLPIFSAVPGWYKVTTAAFVDGWIPAGECKRVR